MHWESFIQKGANLGAARGKRVKLWVKIKILRSWKPKIKIICCRHPFDMKFSSDVI